MDMDTFRDDETGNIIWRTLDQIYIIDGYAAAKAEADRRNVLWFASAGAKRIKAEADSLNVTWSVRRPKPQEAA